MFDILYYEIKFLLDIFLSISLFFISPFFYYYDYFTKNKKEFHHIMITGASRGIGRTLALEFSQKQYCKSLHLFARNKNDLQNIQHICQKINPKIIISIHVIDVTDREKMKNIINKLFKIYPIDLVIANAGVTLYTSEGENIDAIYNLYNVNIFGTLNTILPIMEIMKKGTIAIISSQAANTYLPGINSYYSSSKSALLHLQGLRKISNQIDLVMVQPGYVKTVMTERIDDFPLLKYFVQNLNYSCQYIVKELELGNLNITFPKISQICTLLGNSIPPFIIDKFWKYSPNLIMGEKCNIINN